MSTENIENYHKFHRMTMSYAEASKYIDVGWTLVSMNRVLLRGINKEYDECILEWTKDDCPIDPIL